MKTLKEILLSAGASEEFVNSVEDISFYEDTDISEIKGDFENKLKANKIDSLVNFALLKSGARNISAVKALLNLENAEIENDTVSGLDAQIDGIRKENGFLFENKNQSSAGPHTSYTAEDYSNMSDEQYYSIKYRKEN